MSFRCQAAQQASQSVCLLPYRFGWDTTSVAKFVLVDAALLDELVRIAPKAFKAKVVALQAATKTVDSNTIELLNLLNDFIQKVEEK